MIDIHKQEDNIFHSYKAKLGLNSEVSSDGLHYLGDFYYLDSFWGRNPGTEEEKWREYCQNKRGLVILTKDLNDESAWDIREEHGRKNGCSAPTPSIQYAFYRNLRSWIYGLLNIDKEGNMPLFPNTLIAQECFENEPWVRINLKKIPGKSSIPNSTLQRYISEFKSLLLEQLSIYKDASIYLDCSRKNGIALLKELYPDITAFGDGSDEWIYYSLNSKKVIINSYHPSYRALGSPEDYYNRMRDAVKAFFIKHPNFLI